MPGVAVTAAFPVNGIGFLAGSNRWPNPGLIWMTSADAQNLASPRSPGGFVLNLKVASPPGAETFADRFDPHGYTDNTGSLYLIPWQMVARQDGMLVSREQKILLAGSWLLALLAMASLAVLVGGRMAGQNRRVGRLKAVGATPALVAGVLLAEYVVLAALAATAGLVIGRLAAPLLTSPSAGLLGTAGAPQLTAASAALVLAVALAVAVTATFFPALRAARASTVSALAGAPRQPGRRGRIIEYSARLPVTLLLAARLAARRPRRTILAALSITITESGVVAVLFAHASVAVSQFGAPAGHASTGTSDIGFISQTARVDQVLLVVTIMLAALAAVNAILITQATVQDARHAAAVTRALGATPAQLAAGLSIAQIAPTLAGALLGIAGGYGLFTMASQGGSITMPPAWPLPSLLARWQAPLFFPLMALRSSGMHILGIKRLLRRRDHASAAEASLIMLHAALYLTVVLWVLSPLRALAFIAVQQAVFSLYLGISFRAQPQGDADHRIRNGDRLRPPPGSHCPKYQGRPVHHLPARRPQLPDRASPIPIDAPAQSATGPGPRQGLLRRDRPRLQRRKLRRVIPPDHPSP